ncbi:MAG: LysR family transcriptional regulator [Erysipelotrichales bacterium]|nr:LysR family transcriptional regulator [Erysipelotrichales bacterium]
MNTSQIEIILKVSETLNFTKASEILHISQPSLTYQIKMAESELRFKIFDRTQKSVSITPAGKRFIESLRKLDQDYKTAVEMAQNYSEKYSEDIVISLPYRSAIHKLPDAIKEMSKINESVLITPHFGWRDRINSFINGTDDIIFEDYENLKNIKGIKIIPFYESRIYFICKKNHPLANKKLIHMDDLKKETLMVGGGSQYLLKVVQQRVLDTLHIPFFNSDDHDTTLTNIEAERAIVLAPGFLHDRNDSFVWIPFDCHETIKCCLAIREDDNRKSIKEFIDIILKLYETENPLTL